MLDSELLNILRCPVTGQNLKAANAELLASLNEAISAKRLRDASGGLVEEPIEGLLVTLDGRVAHAIRHGIPTLIPGESIDLSQLKP